MTAHLPQQMKKLLLVGVTKKMSQLLSKKNLKEEEEPYALNKINGWKNARTMNYYTGLTLPVSNMNYEFIDGWNVDGKSGHELL